jgi:hypothetical protein
VLLAAGAVPEAKLLELVLERHPPVRASPELLKCSSVGVGVGVLALGAEARLSDKGVDEVILGNGSRKPPVPVE